jgi:hypothetical protein
VAYPLHFHPSAKYRARHSPLASSLIVAGNRRLDSIGILKAPPFWASLNALPFSRLHSEDQHWFHKKKPNSILSYRPKLSPERQVLAISIASPFSLYFYSGIRSYINPRIAP